MVPVRCHIVPERGYNFIDPSSGLISIKESQVSPLEQPKEKSQKKFIKIYEFVPELVGCSRHFDPIFGLVPCRCAATTERTAIGRIVDIWNRVERIGGTFPFVICVCAAIGQIESSRHTKIRPQFWKIGGPPDRIDAAADNQSNEFLIRKNCNRFKLNLN